MIGAHDATVQPDFGEYALIDFGPVLPQVRLPAEAPLGIGVNIRLGDSDVSDLNQLVARDAVIASQPQGEIAAVRSTIISMGVDAVLRGLGTAMLAVLIAILGWKAIGQQRRRAIWATAKRPDRRQKIGAVAVALLTVAGLVLVATPERPRSADGAWLPIGTVFPLLPADPVLDKVEIAEGATTSGSKAIVEGALGTYQTSVAFYGKLAKTAAEVTVRTPLDGEKTALVVTDRHDNIGMDPVARAIADQAQAEMLIDLGDDTSNGASWETFSLNSLAREFDGFDVVSVAGNHDTGPTIRKQMKDKGFTVLDGKPVTVNGIRFLGSSDPRSSGLTHGYNGDETDNIAAIRSQDTKLTEAACDDGDVNVIAVHSPASVKKAASPDVPISSSPATCIARSGRPSCWSQRSIDDDPDDRHNRRRRLRLRLGQQAAPYSAGHDRHVRRRRAGGPATGDLRLGWAHHGGGVRNRQLDARRISEQRLTISSA